MVWGVGDFIQACWQSKSTNKLSAINYKKELERLKNESVSKIKIDGISHGTIEKINLLKIDSLTITSKEFRVISFTIFNGEHILKSLGNSVTKEMKDLIENAGLEDFILFDNIKIVTKSGKIMRHASLQLKIK